MYVFRARYTCPGSHTELDGDPGAVALAVEQALALALCDRIGVVIMERIHIEAHPAGPGRGCTLHLVVGSPDHGTHIRRVSQAEAQRAIEAIVLRTLRELFGHVVVEAATLGYEAREATWGEAAPGEARPARITRR